MKSKNHNRAAFLLLLTFAAAAVLLPTAAAAEGGHDAQAGHDAHGHDDHAHHQAEMAKPVTVEKLPGLTIPDIPVVTQDGRELSFRDLVGSKVVAMNFIFTTCTTICPPMGANFAKLQKILGDEVGESVQLISVSVDPVVDTPERLRAWSEGFGAGPGWTLVTGSKVEITRLLKDLQVFTPDIRDHSATVILGNAAAGTWTRAYGLAPPARLAEILDDMIDLGIEGGAR